MNMNVSIIYYLHGCLQYLSCGIHTFYIRPFLPTQHSLTYTNNGTHDTLKNVPVSFEQQNIPSLISNGYQDFFPRDKVSGVCVVNYSPPISACML